MVVHTMFKQFIACAVGDEGGDNGGSSYLPRRMVGVLDHRQNFILPHYSGGI